MAFELIKELEERNVPLSLSMKEEILQAERISNEIIGFTNWVGRMAATVSAASKNIFMGNTEASKG